MPSLICSTRSMGLVGASEAGRGFEGEVGGGAVASSFRDFDSGPTRELGHRLDLRGPALRLPGDVDIFFLAELLFADSGGRWSSADRAPMLMSASPVRGRRGFDAGRAQRELRGHRQRSPNSAAITLGRSASLAPRCAGRRSERSAELAALTWFAALTRAREAGRRDAIFNLLDPLDGPGRCVGSLPRLRR